jgi:hypothetical protein
MEQRLMQSPQMIQAMQILQLSSLDLAERIEQELTENPFLEEQEPETDDGADAPRTEPETHDPEERGVESMLDELERYDRDFGDGTRTRIGSSEDGDKKLEAMQNTAASYHSLGDALLEQLALSDMDEREREDGDDSEAQRAEAESKDPEERGVESMLEELERYDRDFGDGTRTRVGSAEDGDKKLEAMQNTPASYHSLGDALLSPASTA